MLRERGFYVIKDQFFVDFPDPYLKGNKGEHRPHYFALRDPKANLAKALVDDYRAGRNPFGG